ncbi:hypothetical protein GF407_16570 [candidate division KSB1 bacterium]|nr:hypothetical protein [candidate division KSB1 bacterium]
MTFIMEDEIMLTGYHLDTAMANNNISLDIIDAMEFRELAEQYNIHGIPVTVINGKEYIFGALSETEFLRTLTEKVTG